MIVGTAGHIDHGKTTLVRALTGVDTDRLPEEKKRGISIELGYAFLEVPGADGRATDERIGFIDVPGHERLVHTMLAGATGIDFALLLVAADDGVMPQTREHLAVLSLLGIASGAAVITKADRVDAARLQAVRAETELLLQGSSLAGAPVLAVSAVSGEGVADLKGLLLRAAAGRGSAADGGRAADDGHPYGRAFRLAVDRAFTLDGVGTVVTGTVHAGRVRIGDELRLVPGDKTARVRSLRAQNREVAVSQAGERCAIGLAGVSKDEVARGQWLVAPTVVPPVPGGGCTRLDARLTLWHEEGKPLRSGAVVHVHLGAADVMGSVAVLDGGEGDALAPGFGGRVQLVLREPIGAWAGDRVVLRDASATRTLAGGVVLDPVAPTRYRRTPQRLQELSALEVPVPVARLFAVLAAAPLGLDWKRYVAAQGLLAVPDPTALLARAMGVAEPAMTGADETGSIEGDPRGPVLREGDWALDAAHAEAARTALLHSLASFHERHPDELGPDAARLRRLALPRLAEPLFRALLGSLVAAGRLVVRGAFVHLPEHGVRLSASEERIAQKVAPQLAAAGFEGAWARDLARDSGESEALMRTTLARLAQRGELHQVVKDLYYPVATMATLAAIARRVAASAAAPQPGVVTAATFRDATQLGRKRAIQILEHFDRIGLTRRVGDQHRVRGDSTLFVGEAEQKGGAR